MPAQKSSPKAETENTWVPFYVPSTDRREEREVVEAIRSGWLTSGPKVKLFEQKVCEYTGARHAVAVNSCTAAMHVALGAAGVGKGDEVILKDREGKAYRYQVSEVMEVNPDDVWVMGQVVGRDMVTLQTCTPIPTFEKRLIVRADRV